MKTKRCTKCKETKKVEEFSKDASCKDGLHWWCKECIRQYNQRPEQKERVRQYQQRPEREEYRRQYYQRPEVKEHRRQYRQRPEVKEHKRQHSQRPESPRSQIIQLYGGQCFSCDNPHYGFLEIDHIFGSGTQHRKECGSPYLMYKAILAEGYRPDKYRVLCKACNQLARWFSIEEIQAIFKPLRYPDNSQQVYKRSDGNED